jgi:hypothetical protein
LRTQCPMKGKVTLAKKVEKSPASGLREKISRATVPRSPSEK